MPKWFKVELQISRSRELWLWAVVIVTFGVLDIATTLYGIYGHAPERHYAYVYILELFEFLREYGFFVQVLTALSLWKLVAIGVLYSLYRLAPQQYRVGVPIGAILFGLTVFLWNLYAIGHPY
jgi:hypothetical protein